MNGANYPKRYDLVVCRITKIDPHSASCEVIEYKANGLIHATEVAKRWVRDIREFLKEGQYIVCRVLDFDRNTNTVILSAKRLSKEEGDRKLNEFKREKKSEKVLELIAKKMNKNLEDAYSEVGHSLQEEFGSLTKAFEIAVKNPALFRNRGLPKTWAEEIIDFLEKTIAEKTHEIKAKLKLISYRPDGVELIKKTLLHVNNFEVKYISAPTYMLIARGKNYKDLKNKLALTAEEITKEISKSGGEASFEILENK